MALITVFKIPKTYHIRFMKDLNCLIKTKQNCKQVLIVVYVYIKLMDDNCEQLILHKHMMFAWVLYKSVY